MRFALFITDEIYVKLQILELLENVYKIELEKKDFMIFVKKAKRSKNFKSKKMETRQPIKLYYERTIIFCKRKLIQRKSEILWEQLTKEINVREIETVNDLKFSDILTEIPIGIFINYDEIIKPEILNKLPLALNIHNGILPNYRGCQTIVWQMLKQEYMSALTVHKMNAEVDTGDIVYEYPYKIDYTKGILQNNILSLQNLSPALFMTIRKLIYCDASFIKQAQYKIQSKYFKRPTITDINKFYE